MRTAEGGYIRNRYDPEGLRYELYENGKVSRFIFSGREVVTEVDDNYGLKAAIIRGHEILAQKDSKDSSYYYFNNAHGDVTALLDGRGEIVNRYKYDAFGNTVEAVEKVHNRFRYAGEQFDPVTGQYYLRARFYNPVIGRFTQEDTYRDDELNLYAYVQNNPVKYVDPSGYCGESKQGMKYPERTPEAQTECQRVVNVANAIKAFSDNDDYYVNKNPVISIFLHKDGTVSVGISGKPEGNDNSNTYAKQLENALNESAGHKKYTVYSSVAPELLKQVIPVKGAFL